MLNKGLKPPIVPLATDTKDIDPDCPSLQNRNPYELLAKNFDNKIFDEPVNLFEQTEHIET